jgi:uncharacterized protein YbaR (Trm112 family)
MNEIDDEFLEIIRCPVTRSRLRREGDELVGEIGGLRYPIRDGIPVLLPEEAQLPAEFASLEEFRRRYNPATSAAGGGS